MKLTPTGSIQNWLLFCRTLDRMNNDPGYSDGLGLRDLSLLKERMQKKTLVKCETTQEEKNE